MHPRDEVIGGGTGPLGHRVALAPDGLKVHLRVVAVRRRGEGQVDLGAQRRVALIDAGADAPEGGGRAGAAALTAIIRGLIAYDYLCRPAAYNACIF